MNGFDSSDMTTRRACDTCRRRKVKCDQSRPCSNCRISNLQCHHLRQFKRRGPQVPKVHVDGETPVPNVEVISAPRISPVHPQLANQDPPSAVSHLSTRISHSERLGVSGSIAVEISKSIDHKYEIMSIHGELLNQVQCTADRAADEVAAECVDLFFQYIFPNTPIASEVTLRDGVSLLTTWPAVAPIEEAQIPILRSFTLITALCAFVISAIPSSLITGPYSLSASFMKASKTMLRLYEEHDLEHPDSTSLTIRMWHSAVIQNTTGRVGASWHYHAEAACMAQRLRLYDEDALQKHSKLESKLLRVNFWLLYLAEKTQVAFEARPPLIDDGLVDKLSLLEIGTEQVSLLDTKRKVNHKNLEDRVFIGFHLKRRVWAKGANLVRDLKSYSRGNEHSARPGELKETLMESYLAYIALIDELPTWLRHPDGFRDIQMADKVASYQRICFWAQRSNIMTVFHCMKLVILQKAIDTGLANLIGLSESPLSWAIRKMEIAQDFLYELQMAPFDCLKVQGETAIDRVRRVGTILLELFHSNTENEAITARIKLLFDQVLETLTKLDSRASDESVLRDISSSIHGTLDGSIW